MGKQSRDKKIKFIVTAAALVFLVAAFSLLFYFLFDGVKKKRAEIRDAYGQFYQYQKGAESVKVLERNLSELEQWKEEMSGLILNKNTIVRFIEDTERLASTTDVALKMKSVDIFENTSEKPRFAISAGGSFSSIYQFIRLLESSPYKIELIGASIAKSENEKSDVWAAELSLRLLSFKNEEI